MSGEAIAEALSKRPRLLEIWVAGIVIAVAGAFLLEALARIEEEAEKVAVEATVRNMDSGLRFVQAQQMIQQLENERAGLLLVNPVVWLEKPPAGYLGEVDQVDPTQLEKGTWIWDRRARTLYHRPRRTERLKVGNGAQWLAWKVVAAGGGRATGPLGILRVEAVVSYEWRP